MSEAPAGVWKSRAVIIGIFLLFFLPILGSWYLVFFTGYKHDGGGVEHGILITPARPLPDAVLTDPLNGQTTTLHGKWTMFTLEESGCDQHCLDNLYRMRQIRFATGTEMQRLQRATYFAEGIKAQRPDEIFKDYNGHLVLSPENVSSGFLANFPLEDVSFDRGVFLIDPAGLLMMYYPADTGPSGIIRDLKRLLRISKLD